jgi:hypothetical protein
MDWSSVLGWGSPIGIGVFFAGWGVLWLAIAKFQAVRQLKDRK